MKKIILLLLSFLCLPLVQGQEAYRKYGKISPEELAMKNCEFEPDAPAVVIFDDGKTTISMREGGFIYIFERKVRIKIFTDAGTEWSEVGIPYYNSSTVSESVYDIQACSYNFEQDKLNAVVLNATDCHEEKINKNWSRMKFAIPNARAGSIIEYTYKIESNYMFNLPDWEFQWKIPVMSSRYKVGMVPFYTYQFVLQGAGSFHEYKKEESEAIPREYMGVKFVDLDYSFGMKNLRSFKDESYITTMSDYIIKLDFQLAVVNYPNGTKIEVLTTWPALIKDLAGDTEFGKFAEAAKKQAAKLINVAEISKLPEKQRFDSVINFVKHKIQWNGKYGVHTQQKMKDMLTTGKGSSAEINLFATGLLNAVGLNAFPVLLSTRSHGKIKSSYPFLNAFNNAVILVRTSQEQILADATDKSLANNRLPIACLNDAGLIIEKDKENWVKLATQNAGKTRTMIETTLKDNQLVSFVRVKASEYDGLFMRSQYGTDKEAILKHLREENESVADSSLVIKNMEDANSPYELNYVVENRPGISDKNIYIQPFLREVPGENPFKSPTRTYPVDLIYPNQRSFACSFKIPEGYEVEYLPENRSLKMGEMEFDYQINRQDQVLLVTFVYMFKKSVFTPEEYKNLRFFYGELIGKAGEKIVLRKK